MSFFSPKMKSFFLNKYVITVLIFLIVMLFFSRYNLISRWGYARTIDRLETEIGEYKEEIKKNKKKILEIQSDDDMLERYGRERFYFKRENEDIYIINEDDDE